jgi:hypothetical protein
MLAAVAAAVYLLVAQLAQEAQEQVAAELTMVVLVLLIQVEQVVAAALQAELVMQAATAVLVTLY